MKQFLYVATNQIGKKEKGSILSPSEEEALQDLKKAGKIVLNIREDSKKTGGFLNGPSLSFEERLMITKHMATMVEAGITLTETFETFAEQEPRANNKKMFENILKNISSGQTLAESLKEYPSIFSDIYINMIAVGEESGTLSETLQYLEIQMEKEYEIRKKVVSALIYPGVIVSITVTLMLGIVIFIIPKITKIFDALGGELPLPTRIMIGTSSFMIEHPFQTVLIIFATIAISTTLLKLKILKPFWHSIALRLPVLGRIFTNVNLARFARNMSSLLKAGVPITRALDITSKMFTNHYYHKKVAEAHAKVEQGSKLFEALKGDEKLFPGMMVKMIQVGEKTGKLEKSMENLAVVYERDVDDLTRNLSVMLEPILLVFMGGMVGGVALSVILPIYQIPNLIQK